MAAVLGVDELAGDAHAAAHLAHAAFQHVAHAEFAPDLLHIHRAALVGEARVPRDDEQPADARQAGDDVLDHAVGEIVLIGIAAQVDERQHGDGGAGGNAEARLRLFHRCVGAGLLAHGADEPKAPAREGADETLLLAIVLEGAARGVDEAGQRRVGDDASRTRRFRGAFRRSKARSPSRPGA